MASTDSRPVPIKNTAFRAVFPILNNTGALVTGAAGLDSEVSKDQGTFADCTNEATEIATSSGVYYLDLTSTEMNADSVAVIVKTSTTDAKTTVLVFYPQESGDIKVDVQSFGGSAGTFSGGRPEVNTTHVGGTSQTGRDLGASVLLSPGTGTGQLSLSSGAVLLQATQTGVTIPTVTNLTNPPSWNAAWDAEVQSEVQDAIEANHLDHLLAATYDPASKPGAADALLNELVESDSGVARYTANALEQAPSGTGASAASIRAEIDANSTQLAAIVADTNELQTDWANGGRLDLLLDAVKAKTDNLPSDPADASDIAALLDALPTAAENAAALMDLSNGVETSITPRQALRLILAASAGKLSGAATTTVTIRNVGDSKDRITATVDADGNRSAVTVDAT